MSERIISEDSAKLFHIKGVVLDLSSLGSRVDSNTVFKFDNPTRILDDSFRVIGYADVYVHSEAIRFNGSIRYDSPIRLDIETDSKPWYVRPYGHARYYDETPNIMELNRPPAIREISLSTIRLLSSGPVVLPSLYFKETMAEALVRENKLYAVQVDLPA